MKNSGHVTGAHCFSDRRENKQGRNYNDQQQNKINCPLGYLLSVTKDILCCSSLIFTAFFQR